MNIKEIVALIGDIAVIFSVIFIVIQIRIAIRSYKLSLSQKKRDRILSIIARWNNIEFAACRRAVIIYFRKSTKESFAQNLPSLKRNEDIRGKSAHILNFFDELAIGVNRDVFDFDIAYAFFQPLITYYWELLFPFVKWMRERDKDETIFKEVEEMHNTFLKRSAENYSAPSGKYWDV